MDNREAAIRVPTNPAGTGTTNFELKTVDGAANPHLALGIVIAAARAGVRTGLKLTDPVTVDPGLLSEDERRVKGIHRLPVNVAEAIERLRRNRYLTSCLGEELARAFLAVRQKEWDALKDADLKHEVALLLERY
jgi:glutamine synthetase